MSLECPISDLFNDVLEITVNITHFKLAICKGVIDSLKKILPLLKEHWVRLIYNMAVGPFSNTERGRGTDRRSIKKIEIYNNIGEPDQGGETEQVWPTDTKINVDRDVICYEL